MKGCEGVDVEDDRYGARGNRFENRYLKLDVSGRGEILSSQVKRQIHILPRQQASQYRIGIAEVRRDTEGTLGDWYRVPVWRSEDLVDTYGSRHSGRDGCSDVTSWQRDLRSG
jgi:hypothetical protein